MSESNNTPNIPDNTQSEPAHHDRGFAPQSPDNTAGEGGEAAPPKQPGWVDKRVARYTHGMYEAQRQRDAERTHRVQVETEFAEYKRQADQQRAGQPPGAQQEGQAQPAPGAESAWTPGQPVPGNNAPQTPQRAAEVAASVERIRLQAAENARFDSETNAMVTKGRGEHANFDQAIEGWRAAGLDIGTNRNQREIISLINSLPDGAELFHRIGQDPELAEHIANLSPAKAAFEIRGLSSSTASQASATVQAMAAPPARPDVSNAPRPPQQPANARGTSAAPKNLYDPNLTPEQFARARGHRD